MLHLANHLARLDVPQTEQPVTASRDKLFARRRDDVQSRDCLFVSLEFFDRC